MRILKNYQVCFLAISLILTYASGCKSISSQLLDRDEVNGSWRKTKLRGVPITLNVPTHVQIQIVDKTLLTAGSDRKAVLVFDKDTKFRDVRTEFIIGKKIFMVDLKRPAAGSLDYTAEFSDQYFSKLQSKINDQTIEQTSKAIERILGKVAPQGLIAAPTAARQKDAAINLTEVDSVQAAGVFDLDAPDLELQIEEFLNCYLNGIKQ